MRLRRTPTQPEIVVLPSGALAIRLDPARVLADPTYLPGIIAAKAALAPDRGIKGWPVPVMEVPSHD